MRRVAVVLNPKSSGLIRHGATAEAVAARLPCCARLDGRAAGEAVAPDLPGRALGEGGGATIRAAATVQGTR